MPNNPVQIILNHSDFLRAPDPAQGGGGKDFFPDADAAFDAHKRSLVAAVDQIVAHMQASSYLRGTDGLGDRPSPSQRQDG